MAQKMVCSDWRSHVLLQESTGIIIYVVLTGFWLCAVVVGRGAEL